MREEHFLRRTLADFCLSRNDRGELDMVPSTPPATREWGGEGTEGGTFVTIILPKTSPDPRVAGDLLHPQYLFFSTNPFALYGDRPHPPS